MRIRQIAISLVSVFAMAVSTTVGFASTSVSAATVTSGVCTATVGNATGVTMTVVTGECVLKFTNVGTTTWTVPSGITTVRVLVVGAGGGGSADAGGGGGGGQVVDSSNIAASGEVTISVGAGGSAGTGNWASLRNGGRTGTSSSFVSSQTVTAKGGSGATGRSGADNKNADGTANNTGYTGGGGAYGTGGSTGTGGALFMGGGGGGKFQGNGGGGGGGAGGAGQSKSISVASDGGVGLSSNITGTAIFYGGGGGGSTTYTTDGPAGAGGNGGGGAGSKIYVNGVSGVNGFGGGGGGGGSQASSGGGTGGSGVVIVRYSLPVIPSNTGAPVISGTAATGSTLTTSNGTWRGPPTSYGYQWKRSSTSTGVYEDIATATSSSYVVSESDIGYFIKVSVSGTNGLGSASATSAATTAVVDVAPTNTALPVISGNARNGATLTTTNGSWTSSPTSFAYQWQRAGISGTYSNITSETGPTYVVDESDVGYFIKVSVTATNNIGPSSAALSAATSAVVDIAPTNTALPVVSGTARTGATLTTTNGSWTSSPPSSTTYTYQWQRASSVGGTYSNITSATGATYVVDESDVGDFIKVSVIATNGIGPSSAALSAATSAVVDIAPTNRALPVISGTARTGATLTTSNGSWTSAPNSSTTYTYQWKRASSVGGTYSNITSETGATYVVDESDVGDFIKVSVIATNGVGSSSAVLSAATSAVVDIAPTNRALPVISGTARTGATLTTSNGSWTSAPNSSTTYTYQWKRASSVGGTYSNITSATDKTYELTDADIDNFIKVSVIARNGVGSSSAVLSAATSVVVDLADSVVPTVTSPDATATGFTFTISNYLSSYTYALTTSKGTVSRSNDDVTVTGLAAGESATVTIAVTRTNYKPASKTVTGSATPTATTTTVKPAVVIEIQAPATTVAPGQAPVTTVAQGQASVATIAPSVSRDVTSATTTTTTTTTTTPATAIVPLVKNAAIPTASPETTPETTPRLKNADFSTGQPVAPMIAEVSTGESALDVGGVRTNVDVSRENNKIVLKSGTYQAVLSGLDSSGGTRSLDADGNLRLTSGDVLRLNMGGFKVGTQVEVWMFSTPVRLGTTKVETDGRVTGTFTIPKNIEDGSHRIAVTAKLPNGKSTTFTLGILVGDVSTTSTLTRVLIAIPITLAIGFGFLLPTQIRRRRKARPA